MSDDIKDGSPEKGKMKLDRNVANLKIVAEIEKSNQKAAIENIKRNMDEMIESFEIMSRLKKEQYDSLIKAGFNEKQALYLASNWEN